MFVTRSLIRVNKLNKVRLDKVNNRYRKILLLKEHFKCSYTMEKEVDAINILVAINII